MLGELLRIIIGAVEELVNSFGSHSKDYGFESRQRHDIDNTIYKKGTKHYHIVVGNGPEQLIYYDVPFDDFDEAFSSALSLIDGVYPHQLTEDDRYHLYKNITDEDEKFNIGIGESPAIALQTCYGCITDTMN